MAELIEVQPHRLGHEILTEEAIGFVVALHRAFAVRRTGLLHARAGRQAAFDAGDRPGFPSQRASKSELSWKLPAAPKDLEDRRVEITGPVDRKMMINALNSGARVFMADFEDATSPTWDNVIDGQRNVRDAVCGTISLEQNGREYQLHEETATLMVRPRGWHLDEKHLRIDGARCSASLFDFGLAVFHDARTALDRGSGPYFYLPKLESAAEAALWADVFAFAEDALRIGRGSIRATVLIETLPAAFEMDEILFALRDHALGLNAGRWDYIFSVCKRLGSDPAFVLPDRAEVTMVVPFMRAYTDLLVQTCHQRGAHAIGGMAAFIPNRRDPDATAIAAERVAADKAREAAAGFDGTWVAHPDLIDTALAEFDFVLGDRPHQLDRLRHDVVVCESDLLAIDQTPGEITDAGVHTNVDVGVRYIASWLAGTGAAAIHGLMEDAATAEISRAQLGQWARHRVRTTSGRLIDADYIRYVVCRELDLLTCGLGPATKARFDCAAELFADAALTQPFPEFFTLAAYEQLP